MDTLNKTVCRHDTGISSLTTTVTSSHSSEFNTLVASVSSDSGIQFGKLSEMSNSGGDVSKSTSDSEKSPKQENPIEDEAKLETFKDVDDDVTEKIEIIEKIESDNSNTTLTKEDKCDEPEKENTETATVSSSLKRTNSVKARANLFQELEKKQKEIEKPVLQKPKRGNLFYFVLLCTMKIP